MMGDTMTFWPVIVFGMTSVIASIVAFVGLRSDFSAHKDKHAELAKEVRVEMRDMDGRLRLVEQDTAAMKQQFDNMSKMLENIDRKMDILMKRG